MNCPVVLKLISQEPIPNVGNEFLIQPTKDIASKITLETNRPEDLAFASPVRAGANNTNLGSANVIDVTVSNQKSALLLLTERVAF